MRSYVDSATAYTVYALGLSTTLALPSGAHNINMQGWDNTDALYIKTMLAVVHDRLGRPLSRDRSSIAGVESCSMPRVFVSSTRQDNQLARLVTEAISEMGAFQAAWSVGGSSLPVAPNSDDVFRNRIEDVDVLVVVLGPPSGQLSQRAPELPDEREFLSKVASDAGKPVFVFVPQEPQIDLSHYKAHLIETYDTTAELRNRVVRALSTWMSRQGPDDFGLVFSPLLTGEQVRASLSALADYFRSCGGVGLQAEFDLEDVLVKEPEGVLI